MTFAIFRCCPTSVFLKQYESSTDAVLRRLGVDFLDVKEFNCCGYPLKSFNFKAYVLSSARNLALAEKKKTDLLTLCNCCYGSLKQAQQLLKEDDRLNEEINRILKKEGLVFQGKTRVRHLLEVLYEDIGLEAIRAKRVTSFENLNIATHYGCHLIRPGKAVRFDSPMFPSLFDELVEVTGAKSIPWQTRLDCCGAPMWGIYDNLSMDLTEKKITDAKQSGADCVCVACVYCHLQFDRVQKKLLSGNGTARGIPPILYTQLLGLSLGIDEKVLGIDRSVLATK